MIAIMILMILAKYILDYSIFVTNREKMKLELQHVLMNLVQPVKFVFILSNAPLVPFKV